VIFGSTTGVLLTPLWWLALLIHTLIEEESLERELGQEFCEYKKQTKGRIFPRLPV
jgi:protein-S-isoprenylcysteine O-methyltransferase Ste14